tara:strand:+ start:2031 stop:2339 length:309 start_codon:yes stop_codon:yes gene_type:complete
MARIPTYSILKNGDKLPTFIILGTTTMRFRRNNNDYYRDAGNWSTSYKFKDGILISDIKQFPRIDGIKLIKITKKKWLETNKNYLPSDELIKYDLQNRSEIK